MFSLKNISYDYHSGTDPIIVDRFDADQGSVWILLGSSGSGKTTVLNLLSGLILPQNGTIEVCGKHLSDLSERDRDLFRGEYIGIVFQTNHLLATLTVQENLELVRFVNEKRQNIDEITSVLSRLDISRLADRYPESLSEGQKQRVAIARSLVNNPKLIIADEPTSSLDDRNTELVLELLFSEAERIGATLLVATHDQRVKDRIENVFNLDTK